MGENMSINLVRVLTLNDGNYPDKYKLFDVSKSLSAQFSDNKIILIYRIKTTADDYLYIVRNEQENYVEINSEDAAMWYGINVHNNVNSINDYPAELREKIYQLVINNM